MKKRNFWKSKKMKYLLEFRYCDWNHARIGALEAMSDVHGELAHFLWIDAKLEFKNQGRDFSAKNKIRIFHIKC